MKTVLMPDTQSPENSWVLVIVTLSSTRYKLNPGKLYQNCSDNFAILVCTRIFSLFVNNSRMYRIFGTILVF